MYLPTHFAEDRPPVLHALMRAHPLATVVAMTPAGLVANHIPLLLAAGADGGGTRLLGHVARGNTLWREAAGAPVLAIFQGPQHYISPGWYPTKQETGKVVPTWNYCAVHVQGPLVVHDDPAWLRALVERLTTVHESAMPAPWAVSDAPADYIDTLLRNIVGIEIPVERIAGKWKASQNQPEGNRAGVVEALARHDGPDAAAMAQLVKGGTADRG